MPATGARDRIRGGLPSQLTSFIGRDRELRQLRELLDGSRLLTLTGAGGSGKTRLGLRLVEEVSGEFADGVFFVPLAPVGSPELVLSSIAHSIGLRDSGDRPLADRLADHLVDKQVLLLLDTFEHLIALIRPDGYLAARGSATHSESMRDHRGRWSGGVPSPDRGAGAPWTPLLHLPGDSCTSSRGYRAVTVRQPRHE